MRNTSFALLLVLLLSAAVCEAGGPSASGCRWATDEFVAGGFDDAPLAAAVWDDGSGPALYVGGRFVAISGETYFGIARWDGGSWSPLGARLNGPVFALAVFDEGAGPKLFAAGDFYLSNGVALDGVARWDGISWSPLEGPSGVGVLGEPLALEVFDDGSGPALYVGGWLIWAGGVLVSNVARWNGSTWSRVGFAGPDDQVSALEVYDDGSGPALYAGGWFLSVGVPAAHIARWDGTTWSSVGNLLTGHGVDGRVRAFAVYDDGGGPALFVGGEFTMAGKFTASHIARWDGFWATVGDPAGTDGPVSALEVHGTRLVVGGDFQTAGGVAARRVARWNGNVWSALGGGTSGEVSLLASFDLGSGPRLAVGGSFDEADGFLSRGLARWRAGTWSAWAPGMAAGLAGSIFATLVWDDGGGPALYVAGELQFADGLEANNVARWDGSGWSVLAGPGGAGTDGLVRALAIWDDGSGPALYVGGTFTQAGGVEAHNVARWDGTGWSALADDGGPGDGSVKALAVYDEGKGPVLFVGGQFAPGAVSLLRWDGTAWSRVSAPGGTGPVGPAWALTEFDPGGGPLLIAGGMIFIPDGLDIHSIAAWNGTAWQALSGPSGELASSSQVIALAAFDDPGGPALYAAGYVWEAGGVPVNNVARWDGSDWTGAPPPFMSQPVLSLRVADDGRGPALFVGGLRNGSHDVGRWDGLAWEPLAGPAGTGVDGPLVLALADWTDGVVAGGYFHLAGGVPSSGLGRWFCPLLFADGFESGDLSAWSSATR